MNPFPIHPQGGLCVAKIASAAQTMTEAVSRKPIFLMLWRWPAEDMEKMRSAIASYRREQTGGIISEAEGSIFIWTGRSEGQKQS